jgi:DNA mismatch endonuclease, patch repair protein
MKRRSAPMTRSENMRRITGRNTAPELAVRRALWGAGYRYRIHCRDLPGTPDIVFRGRRKVIFVHGCFWHMHDCGACKLPRTNTAYWTEKLARNTQRDARAVEKLVSAGWSVLVVWGCEIGSRNLFVRLTDFLERNDSHET